jgi:2-polyprenyl-3-methyl-5-hydroxy-6-metoxy-1,4-benzoquinol methylase
MDIKESGVIGEEIDQHWYYRYKAKAMIRLLRGINFRTVLDVGAGSGFFSKYLLSQTMAREAWCVDIGYADDFDATESGKLIHFRRQIEPVSPDLILLMDVLEHVDNDLAFLKEYAGNAPPATMLLISVPAFQCLWSEHDVFLGHKRRYTLHQLEELVQRAGLEVRLGAYYFALTLPIAAATRAYGRVVRKRALATRSQLQLHNPFANIILASLSRLELPLLRHNRVAGLTAFCLAEVP